MTHPQHCVIDQQIIGTDDAALDAQVVKAEKLEEIVAK
jgi:hypothetical protein